MFDCLLNVLHKASEESRRCHCPGSDAVARWRGEGGKRPWLAGTAVEQMCVVLDIDNLSAQLAEGFKLDDWRFRCTFPWMWYGTCF